MTRTEIQVPDLNDSFSCVVLDGTQYLIRFSWNDTAGRWSFGLYTMQKTSLVQGIRIVPKFPLNLQLVEDNLPSGVFGVYTDLAAVRRNDFVEGKAIFAYIPAGQEA